MVQQIHSLSDLPHGHGGEKSQRLAKLLQLGHSVPPGFVIPAGLDNPDGQVAGRIAPGTRYVVRSSGDGEDGATSSWAGQLESILDVDGPQNVLTAVERVRDSARGERASAYPSPMTKVHVIVQEQVDAVASGVVFTRNPITGLDERIIEAVSGSSEAFLSGGAEPDRWVWRWGAFADAPAYSSVSTHVVETVATASEEIADQWGSPVDLEWVFDGTRVWWVQLRPIGNLDVRVYSNRISREVLPGAIKPLVWSVNVPLVNAAWIRLFERAIGPTGLQPGDLAKSFGYHAYFNMTAMGELFAAMGMPRDSLELLLGLPKGPASPSMRPSASTLRLVPRLLGFTWSTGRAERRTEDLLGAGRRLVEEYRGLPVEDLTDDELWESIDRLDDELGPFAEANIVVPLLFNLWSRLLHKAHGGGMEVLDIDVGAGLEDQLAQYDPGPALADLAASLAEHGPDHATTREAHAVILRRFGHLSDSGNDFSVVTWAEQPELVLRFAEHHEAPSGKPRVGWEQVVRSAAAYRRSAVRKIAARARTYRVLREAVGSLYTEAYGLYRPLFLELGRRLCDAGWLVEPDDVFFADRAQLRRPDDQLRHIVDNHRTEMATADQLELPETIYGDHFVPKRRGETTEGVLAGTATSRGSYTGPVRVIRSVEHVDRLRDGDVLVVPFSDVGWTPLFGRVGAVVAESGGLLSHSSIIAREYGIPCVVSVPDACSLVDGLVVTVDGDRGEVVVET